MDLVQKIQSFDYIFVDENVFEIYSELFHSIENIFVVRVGEENKNVLQFEKLSLSLLKANIKRNSKILCIGGGMSSDLVGYVASSILRGVQWSIVPTTLLSMVDASIGGKVAINTEFGKNTIGAFHLPEEIVLDYNFLNTLPQTEVDSGKGEILKYCFLSKEVFELVKQKKTLEDIIKECANFKETLVKNDLYEKNGTRIILNLGHTIGHSIEKFYGLPHGIAVACGIRYVVTKFRHSLLDKLNLCLNNLDLSLPSVEINSESLKYCFYDKKNDTTLITVLFPNGDYSIDTKKMNLTEIL